MSTDGDGRRPPIPMQLNYEATGDVEPLKKHPITILLTSSEGIKSPGLLAMIKFLQERQKAQEHIDANEFLKLEDMQMPFYIQGVLVVCPEKPQPWASHAVTPDAGKIEWDRYAFAPEDANVDSVDGNILAFVHNGTPVDSIRLGTGKLYQLVYGRECSEDECVVISGLNTACPAIGGNHMYSADIACVREARMMGLTAINFFLSDIYAKAQQPQQTTTWFYNSALHVVIGIIDEILHEFAKNIGDDEYTPYGRNIGMPNSVHPDIYNALPRVMCRIGSSRTATIGYNDVTQNGLTLEPVTAFTCIDDQVESANPEVGMPFDTVLHSVSPAVTITLVNPGHEFLM